MGCFIEVVSGFTKILHLEGHKDGVNLKWFIAVFLGSSHDHFFWQTSSHELNLSSIEECVLGDSFSLSCLSICEFLMF